MIINRNFKPQTNKNIQISHLIPRDFAIREQRMRGVFPTASKIESIITFLGSLKENIFINIINNRKFQKIIIGKKF